MTSSVELPVPEDDGDADHLPGRRLPAVELPATDGRSVRLDNLTGRSAVFVYPGIGGPGREDLLDEWTALPGARGCTPEACSFRDELGEFDALAVRVFGLSSQGHAKQVDDVRELGLPYPLLSDEPLRLSEELGLPTFDFHGVRHFKRLTLIVTDGTIEGALYPVFPPEQAAVEAVRFVRGQLLRG